MTTIELNPEFLTKNGEKQFAILPYTEFVALKEWIEDVEDLLDLREARESDDGSPSLSIEEVQKELGIR